MVSNESMAGMVIAGRGARACDMCGKERARWYCAADEAYLCESCDRSVHSANAVARRHERAKLGPNGAPMKIKPSHNHHRKIKTINLSSLQYNPALQFPKIGAHHKWWRSSKKRSRTPRKSLNPTGQSFITVNPTLTPEMINTAIIKEEKEDAILLYDLLTADDQFGELPTTATFGVKPEPFSPSPTSASRGFLDLKSEESELAHEVPTYEPLLQELIAAGHGELMEKILPSSPSFCNTNCTSRDNDTSKLELNPLQTSNYTEATVIKDGSAPSKIETDALQSYDLVEGSVVEDGSISINGDSDIDTFDVMDLCSNANLYDDMKGDELREEFPDMEMWQAAYQGACPNMYGGNPFIGKGERELEMGCVKVEGLLDAEGKPHHQRQQQPGYKKLLSLRLDYEEVLNAWSDRGSLWTDGQRPQIVPDICSLDQENVECGMMVVGESSCNSSSCQAGQVPVLAQVDSGREARVLRYKEKRRTRLFSKKIRYEVRKLNAERRPRMKGRFVKRSAIAGM